MKRFIRRSWLVATVLFPLAAGATEGWSQLKAGMSREETAVVLGSELMASRGRGFEVAIYDGRAEVLFLHGLVVAWTAPATSEAPLPPPAAWQFDQVRRVRPRASSAVLPATGPNVRQRAILPAYRW